MSAKRNGSIMLDAHEVNKEKLKRFLTELLLTGDWSDEFDELQPNGLRYWNHMLHLDLIYHQDGFLTKVLLSNPILKILQYLI